MEDDLVKNTKDTLIDVARLLCAKTGVGNTTMNDIALASKKGRRTLYTYFNSKEEIYHAVIESELNLLYESLEEVVDKEMPADKKLLEFIYTRFEALKRLVIRNGTLRASFFRDIWKIETVRKSFDIREINYIQIILKEGVKEGVFAVEDIDSMASVLHYTFKGLEIPYIQGTLKLFTSTGTTASGSMLHFLFDGIRKK
ncbi:MAG: TetR/AcrR family transcriptional regulator [Bacteroidales bacterium]|jgi:AcrR family transcriptional regulator|nr:TetR/AcrR family transcriptional regulator [Bacteroidales bacterium]